MKRYRRIRFAAGIEKLRRLFIHAEWETSDETDCIEKETPTTLAANKQIDLETTKVKVGRVLKKNNAA